MYESLDKAKISFSNMGYDPSKTNNSIDLNINIDKIRYNCYLFYYYFIISLI